MSGIHVEQGDSHIILSGAPFAAHSSNEGQWSATKISNSRFIVERATRGQTDGNGTLGYGNVTSQILYNILLSLSAMHWNGTVDIDDSAGSRKLFFKHGEIVFARSMVIDDRLGEVLFRRGLIRIDELSELSAQVNREKKFGQLLLASGRFSHAELWDALRAQVSDIIKATLYDHSVTFELHAGNAPLPVEIRLNEPTATLLRKCYCYAIAVRDFRDRIAADSIIDTSGRPQVQSKYAENDFIADVLQLARANPQLDSFLGASKLPHSYSMAALMDISDANLCQLEQIKLGQKTASSDLSLLRSRIDTYSILLEKLTGLCDMSGQQIPVEDLQDYCRNLQNDLDCRIGLTLEGYITTTSVHRMLSQSTALPDVRSYYERAIENLCCFLVQSLADVLPPSSVSDIRQLYKSLL